ncbi:hypothetical protein I6P91_004004 [Salmonella enterica]|nr:hypothetical protein [Salmonella enterica]EDQ6154965.1 hypothetical protein [Salmonella enterica subsp. enterica serovar Javiana]EBR7649409.1 hypothetical protein [Salmonella enterica]EEC5487486.1 hypothetical protein [Salmonella enterica]EEF7968614.1 hypothetical protein [Salmonella enterica]
MVPIESKTFYSNISFAENSKPEEYYITMKGSEHSADLLHPELYKPQLNAGFITEKVIYSKVPATDGRRILRA